MLRAEELDLRHLRYFWAVVREGGVTGAARRLHLTQPTVSAQLRKLERQLGARLLRKSGRGVAPTELGATVFEHAERIFAAGQDLLDAVRHGAAGATVRFAVGAADVLPKLVIRSVLAGLLAQREPPMHLIVREGKPDALLADLALHRLDLVLADRPVPPGSGVRAFSHPLGSSALGFFARAGLARRLRGDFPASLDGAPIVLPTEGSAVRQRLDEWLAHHRVAPRVLAEFDDGALMRTCAAGLDCAFPGPLALQEALAHHYRSALVGEMAEVAERYYAISLERRVQHPAVRAILQASPFRDD